MIHTGSRGFGHQIASDYIELFRKRNLGRLKLQDPQLVHAAIDSAEGRNYLQALNAASNFAWANRQLLQEDVVAILEEDLGQRAGTSSGCGWSTTRPTTSPSSKATKWTAR